MLAELLEDLASPTRQRGLGAVDLMGAGPAAGDPAMLADAVAEATHQLEEAAARAVAVGGWTAAEPLRLSKHRMRWLLQCPHRALLVSDEPTGDPTDLVLGLIVDAAAKLLALGAARPVTVDDALGHLDALGNTLPAAHLTSLGEPEASELREDAAERAAGLAESWPELTPGWWPRVEDPVRARLADGAVVLAGKLDIVLGGPPTGRPAVVVEIKGGRWHDTVRNETQFYGLLTALRDRLAPAAVVTLAAGGGQTYREDVRPALLEHTAASVAHALDVAAAIAAGEPAERRPGLHCATCPARATCPSALIPSEVAAPADQRSGAADGTSDGPAGSAAGGAGAAAGGAGAGGAAQVAGFEVGPGEAVDPAGGAPAVGLAVESDAVPEAAPSGGSGASESVCSGGLVEPAAEGEVVAEPGGDWGAVAGFGMVDGADAGSADGSVSGSEGRGTGGSVSRGAEGVRTPVTLAAPHVARGGVGGGDVS